MLGNQAREALFELAADKGGNGINPKKLKMWEQEIADGGWTDEQIIATVKKFVRDPEAKYMPTWAEFLARLPMVDGRTLAFTGFWWSIDGSFGGDPSRLTREEKLKIARYCWEFGSEKFETAPAFMLMLGWTDEMAAQALAEKLAREAAEAARFEITEEVA